MSWRMESRPRDITPIRWARLTLSGNQGPFGIMKIVTMRVPVTFGLRTAA